MILDTLRSWLQRPQGESTTPPITFDPDVGGSFDHYARTWKPARTDMEVTRTGKGVERDPAKKGQLRLPGDEWGEQQGLTDVYSRLIPELNPGNGPIDLLEIGAGAGRLTEVLVRTFNQRLGRYETVDVSAEMTLRLQQRIEPIRSVTSHVISGVDLSVLKDKSFDLCISQSCFSHVNFYDQYRFLRDLRRVLRPGAPFVVMGIFLMGTGDDWTWNRFLNRIEKLEKHARPIFHEFIGIQQLAEMMMRLGWVIECMFHNGYIIRRGPDRDTVSTAQVDTIPAQQRQFPYLHSVEEYLGQPYRRRSRLMSLDWRQSAT